MEKIENGIRIKHEWLGEHQTVDILYNESGEARIEIIIVDAVALVKTRVCFTDEETVFFLAWMTTWYQQGES